MKLISRNPNWLCAFETKEKILNKLGLLETEVRNRVSKLSKPVKCKNGHRPDTAMSAMYSGSTFRQTIYCCKKTRIIGLPYPGLFFFAVGFISIHTLFRELLTFKCLKLAQLCSDGADCATFHTKSPKRTGQVVSRFSSAF